MGWCPSVRLSVRLFMDFRFSPVFPKPKEIAQRKLATAFLRKRGNCYSIIKIIRPNLRLWQGQKRPNNEFSKIFSKTALTIFFIFCVEIPDPTRNNFSLWHFSVKKSPSPENQKIFKFYWQRRHGTRLRLKNGRGIQIFDPFCDSKSTRPSSQFWQGQKKAKFWIFKDFLENGFFFLFFLWRYLTLWTNFTLFKFSIPEKFGKPKNFEIYGQLWYGTRFRLINGRGFQIFGPFFWF